MRPSVAARVRDGAHARHSKHGKRPGEQSGRTASVLNSFVWRAPTRVDQGVLGGSERTACLRLADEQSQCPILIMVGE